MNYRIIREKGKQAVIRISHDGWDSSGIQLTVNKSKQTLYISGWYDSFVGIEGAEIPFAEIAGLFDRKKKA